MRLNPFARRENETRESSLTDAAIAYIQQRASGTTSNVLETAALEIAAGLYGRAMAMAAVSPDAAAAAAISAPVLNMVGREMVRKGEVVFEVVVNGRGVVLMPVSTFSISGGPDPDSWIYDLTFGGPSETMSKSVPAAGVAHLRYAVDPSTPWAGKGPMQLASATSKLTATLETSLANEMSAQVGVLLPVPEESTLDQRAALSADIASLKGSVGLLPTTSGGWGAGGQSKPQHDWLARRIGPNPPEVLDILRSSGARHVLAACGVPIELVESGQGTAAREAYRRFLHSSVAPVAELVVAELREKLDIPALDLNFDALFASDLSGRARAFQSMVGGGMDVAKAAALAGLMDSE